MRRTHLPPLSFASSILSMLLMLAGCGHGGDHPTPPADSPQNAAAPSSSAEASAKSGGPSCVELNVQQCTDRCDAGDMLSCSRLASMYDKVIPLAWPKDPAHTRAILEKACAAGYGPACSWLAGMLDEGRGGPADAARAATLRATALRLEPGECDHGNAASCGDMAFVYHMGQGVAKDRAQGDRLEKRSAELQQAACDAGDASSCLVGELLSDDDPARAAAFLQKGCEGGDPFCCEGLGRRYAQGEGAPKDSKRARDYFAKACAHGLVGDCAKGGAAK